MHNRKRFLGKTLALSTLLGALACTSLLGCSNSSNQDMPTADETATASTKKDYSNTPKGKELSVDFKTKDTNTNWKAESYEEITLSDSSIAYTGTKATVDGSTITIQNAGVYRISGNLTDGQIIIDANKTDFIWLILDNASITNTTGAAIYAKQSDKVTITLAEGSKNSVTDGKTYSYSSNEKTPTACIYSKDDLSINGTGALTVTSNSTNGISTTNDFKLVSGTLNITAAQDGIRGKDSVAIKGGTITIDAKNDGIKSTNDTEDEHGFLYIEDGTFQITAGNDGFQAEKSLWIKDGAFAITTNGGSKNAEKKQEMRPGKDFPGQQPSATSTPSVTDSANAETTESTSYKGIKAGNDLYITGGTFIIDSCDDSLHSNATVTIDQGSFTIQSGDDGIHADNQLTINNGSIIVTESYEGLESTDIVINDGVIDVTASDDGINAGSGSESSSEPHPPMGGGQTTSTSNCSITFNGGTITVSANGDGIDANGSITQTGGSIVVNGPTTGGDGALDYDNTYTMNGGTLIATEISGMSQAPSTDSKQNTIYVNFESTLEAGNKLKLCDSTGNAILSHTTTKVSNGIILSSPSIKQGETYTLYNGTKQLCAITPSASVTCVTDSGASSTIAEIGGGRRGQGGPGGGPNGQKGPGMVGGEQGNTPPNGTPPDMPNNSSN